MESVSAKQGDSSDCDSASSDGSDSGSDSAHGDAFQWPPLAVDLLLYTLTNDPSIRARRAAMKALQAAQVSTCSSCMPLQLPVSLWQLCSLLVPFTKRFNSSSRGPAAAHAS